MLDRPRPSLHRQLISNQLWETVAFVAKAAFMVGLTPWMIRVWGAQGYGEFALASAAFVLLTLVDLGIRPKTRLALCADCGRSQWPSILWHGAFAFAIVGLASIAISFLLTACGIFSAVLKISPSNHNLLFITTVMSMLVMLSGFLLEPIIAAGRIGQTKCATAAGWLASLPCVAVVLVSKGGVITAATAWLACLFAANLFTLFLNRDLFRGDIAPSADPIGFSKFLSTLKDAFWINITVVTWMAKTYGITLVIATLNGPAAAGLFFIILRLSEIISALGAISWDVLLAELAKGSTAIQRRRSFYSSYSWALVLCSHIGLVIAFFTRDFFNLWLSSASPMPFFVGVVVMLLGFASAFNRTVTYASIGLGLAKIAAKWGIVEAILFVGAVLLSSFAFGLIGQLGFALIGTIALIPVARDISEALQAKPTKIWLEPLRDVAPFIAASAATLFAASLTSMPIVKLLAVLICTGIGFMNLSSWLRNRGRESSQELPAQAISAVQSPC